MLKNSFLFLLSFVFVSCLDSTEIEIVKKGHLSGLDFPYGAQTTVGQAIDGYFSNPKWESFIGSEENNIGKVFVDVTGGLHWEGNEKYSTVKLRFLVHVDNGTFELADSYVDGILQHSIMTLVLARDMYPQIREKQAAENIQQVESTKRWVERSSHDNIKLKGTIDFIDEQRGLRKIKVGSKLVTSDSDLGKISESQLLSQFKLIDPEETVDLLKFNFIKNTLLTKTCERLGLADSVNSECADLKKGLIDNFMIHIWNRPSDNISNRITAGDLEFYSIHYLTIPMSENGVKYELLLAIMAKIEKNGGNSEESFLPKTFSLLYGEPTVTQYQADGYTYHIYSWNGKKCSQIFTFDGVLSDLNIEYIPSNDEIKIATLTLESTIAAKKEAAQAKLNQSVNSTVNEL